jgi:cation diffusion facilitator family transporter
MEAKAKQNFTLQVYISLLSVLLFGIKMTAWWLTNSLSILSDALESIVNMLAAFISLYSLWIAAKPSDAEHPYGHGKAEFVSAAIEGVLIVAAGILILYQTLLTFFIAKTLHSLDIGIVLITLTALLNYVAGAACIKMGKKNNSLALQASGKHLQTDTWSTLAIILGLLLIYFTRLDWVDKVVAFIMSIYIIYNGYSIVRASLAGIMDEADMQLLTQMVVMLNKERRENWVDLHNLRVIKYGSKLHVDCHLTVPWYLNVNEAHIEVEQLSELIQKEFGNSLELFVHTDGCLPFSCTICNKSNCLERKSPFQQKLEWTLKNLLSNQKHQLPQ